MQRIALIESGVVINIAIWDGVSVWNPTGYIEVNITGTHVDMGWTYNGTTFSAPD